MPKTRVAFSRRIAHWVTSHPWLKIISLILAVLVWFYVKGEINRFN